MTTVLITNANIGAGLALAKIYAAKGFEVIAVNARPFAPRDYAQLGYDIRELRYDLTKEGAIEDLKTRLGGHPLDLVVLTQGIALEGPDADHLTAEAFEDAMLHATVTPALLAAALGDNLQKGADKKLVLLSSVDAAFASPVTPDALAQKAGYAALHQVLRSLAVEWRPLGITVAVIAAEGQAAVDCIAALNLSQTGQFLDAQGADLAW